MKRKLKTKKGEGEAKVPAMDAEHERQGAAPAGKPEIFTVEVEHPPPHFVAEAARGEINPRLVGDYVEAIGILRDQKRFTFREIAQWLTERFGIEADHNAVYRAYTRGMPEHEAATEAFKDEADEREASL
jgi:hypothetical protein